MSTLTHGFFDKESENDSQFINQSYAKYLSFYKIINEDAHKILNDSYALIGDSPEKLVLSSLYMRSLTIYQSIYFLYEKGFYAEPRILLRSLIEALFYLSASTKDSNVIQTLRLKDEKQKLKMVKKVINSDTKLRDLQNKEELTTIKNEIEKRIDVFSVKDLGIEELSKIADLHDYYLTVYSLLCLSVHNNFTDLESNLVINNGVIVSLSYGPTDNKLVLNLATAMEAIVLSMKEMNNYFKLGLENKIQKQHDVVKTYLVYNKQLKPTASSTRS